MKSSKITQKTHFNKVTNVLLQPFYSIQDSVWDYPGDPVPNQKGKIRKVKNNLDLLEQEIVSGSGISWAICKSAPRPRQITTPAHHHSVFYRPDALPAAQPFNQQYQSTKGKVTKLM